MCKTNTFIRSCDVFDSMHCMNNCNTVTCVKSVSLRRTPFIGVGERIGIVMLASKYDIFCHVFVTLDVNMFMQELGNLHNKYY